MQNYIEAIPTEYKGIKFRSKLEATYAKLFDYFDMNWMYEVEGYQFQDGTWYLPDFYFPDQDLFVEVKGVMCELDEHKINLLNRVKPVIVGFPDGNLKWYHYAYTTYYDNAYCECEEVRYGEVEICTCPCCGKLQFRILSPSNCGIPNTIKCNYFFPDPTTDESWSSARMVSTKKCLICGKTFTHYDARYYDPKYNTVLNKNRYLSYNIEKIQHLFKTL